MTVPKPLIDDIVDGRCLPFIGAGFSVNAILPDGRQMPTWPELTRVLADAAEIDAALPGPSVASVFEKRFGRVQLIEQLRKALFVDEAAPGPIHLAFARLPFDTVYTTNFDTILEDTYRKLTLPYRALVGERQMPFHGGKSMASIVKMHGDVRHEEYITVTSEDYAAYLERYPVIATHLSAMLITRTPLFLGYSLTDPNFQSIQKIVKSRLGNLERMSYVVQFNVEEERIQRLLDDNIHVISLSGATNNERSDALLAFLDTVIRAVDASGARNLRTAEPELFEPVAPGKIEQALAGQESATVLSASSRFCVMLMPASPTSSAVYRLAVAPAVESLGLIALRLEELEAGSSMMETLRTAILQARVCIADISDASQYVAAEVRLAADFGKPLLFIVRKGSLITAEMITRQYLEYDPDDLDRFTDRLRIELASLLGADRLSEAEKLVAEGHYQAAIIILGSLLEQQLWDRAQPLGTFAGKPPRKRSLTYLVEELTNEKQLDPKLRGELLDAIAIRNKAAHTPVEATRSEAEFVLSIVQKVMLA